MDWQIGVLVILAAVVFGALYFKFDKGQSFIDKLFKGVVVIGCVMAILIGLAFIIDDATSDIGDGRDSYYESSDSYDDENYGESNVSFKGSQTGYTGECKICDCSAYDRSPDGICECGHYKTDHKWHN